MLVTSLVTRINTAIGDSGGIYTKDDNVVDYINEAIRDIYTNTSVGYQKKGIVQLIAGGSTVPVIGTETDYLKIHRVIIDETTELEEKDLDTLIELYGYKYLTTRATPQYYWRELSSGKNGNIEIAPPCSKTTYVTVFYTPYPTPLLLDGNTNTVIPEQFIDDIVLFALVRAKERNQDYQGAQHATYQYAGGMLNRAAETTRMDDTYSSITPDPMDYV